MGRKAINLIGQRFGRLCVEKRADYSIRNCAVWVCKCDCGNYKNFTSSSLRSRHTKSCGCLARETASQMMHGQSYRKTHGGTNEKLYGIYRGMIRRCEYPKDKRYKNYGGRGISVCHRWKNSYEAFRDDAIALGYNPDAEYGSCTIDRIDVNGDYSPDNCRFVDLKSQANNKTNNHIITYNGKTQTMTQWAEETGICVGTLFSRLKRGWDIKKTLETSPYEYHHRNTLTCEEMPNGSA